ncbi:MAG: chemotaxis protein CheA [Planctomycetes bacterium]|nr:chemotaxis protein CheA [Planctomycetota bacterium]
MGIDISQFRAVYFEESFEGLETMERGLLALGEAEPDDELVNEIFRAAHSIKGGAGTYGFDDVARLTHVVETLLDEYRAHVREVDRAGLDILLAAVDCLRGLFSAARDGESGTPGDFDDVLGAVARLLGAADDRPDAPAVASEPARSGVDSGWRVRFAPAAHLFRTGNDPLRIMRCLRELGATTVTVDDSALPAWDAFDPESCYAAWEIRVAGEATRDEVAETFEWVCDDAEIAIDRLESAMPDAAGASPVVVPPPSGARAGSPRAAGGDSGSIRVNIEKVDELINMVGELVITQSMLSQIGQSFDESMLGRLRDGLAQLDRNTRELQESVMRVRMVPMSFAFGRLPRVVHDVSSRLDKQVELDVAGEQTELDKTVMERLHDPLVHIVRNSLDHGLETPAERRAAGKPETGRIRLNAFHHGDSIVIEIQDDGRGLDLARIVAKCRERGLIAADEDLAPERAAEMIFAPGFSTAEHVTEVSGRGVGMDVVKRNIDELGGSISVDSTAGAGTTISIRLPLTLAILDGQTVRIGVERYILPLNSIIETIQVQDSMVEDVAGRGEVFKLRERYLRILRLADVFGVSGSADEISKGLLVVVEAGGDRIGLFVDELLAQQQIVIKSLETNYRKVDGVSGATILGDGRVALILDVAGLIRVANAGRRERLGSREVAPVA